MNRILLSLILILAQTTSLPKTKVLKGSQILGVAGVAAPTFVNSQHAANGTNDCTPTLSVTSGNTVVAVMTSTTLANTFSISDTNTNSYSTALSSFTDSGNNVQMEIWTAHIGTTNASDAIDMHVTLSTNFISCVVLQFTGSRSVDKTATNSYSATINESTGTTATTTAANEVLIGAFGSKPSASGAWTQGSGYTYDTNAIATGSGHDTAVEYQIVTSTGAYQALTSTSSTPTSGAGIIVTIK